MGQHTSVSHLLNSTTAEIHGSALVLAPAHFNQDEAKTAFGLVRGSSRFSIVGVVDSEHSGKDAGEVVEGKRRNIPVYETVEHAITEMESAPDYAVIGITTSGGVLPDYLREEIHQAINHRLNIVNGLHQSLTDDPEFREHAREKNVSLHDIRKPRPLAELKFWSGDILGVRVPRIAVLGTDCVIGKRTTAVWLSETCNQNNIRTEMIYTGQTGWMQGHRYGFFLDATPNDFVPGELEQAIVLCDREQSPDLIFIEGQAALRLPSGPCGAELLCSAQAKGVILQHTPARNHFHGMETLPLRIPPLSEEIELIRLYGSEVLAVTLNGKNMDKTALEKQRKSMERELGLPVCCPLEQGVGQLLPVVRAFLDKERVK